MVPEVRYARSGGVNIAYQVVGDAPRDLVVVTGWVSNLEALWEEPEHVAMLERLSASFRVILFDKRGTGLSDRVPEDDLPNIETRMDDVRAVMDSVGSERAALWGTSEGGPMCAVFAATYPERTSAIVLYGSYARRAWAPDYPWAPTPEERQVFYDAITSGWGGVVDLETLAPSAAQDPRIRRWWARYLRSSASPGAALALARMNTMVDIRAVLPSIRVPALVLHRRGDRDISAGNGRYLADHIPGARLVELSGDDHLWFVGDWEAIVAEIESFVLGAATGATADRVLATILFTDLVGSTERALELGDRRWRALLGAYHGLARRQVEAHRGEVVDIAGDGLFAAFDGPARAVRCALAITAAAPDLGVEVRAGVHTGEVEKAGGALRGVAVHVGARIGAMAGAGQVLVSQTVHDLVSGSGLHFESTGSHALKGLPGEWPIYAAHSTR